jgi:hypothetical protein
VPIRESDQCVEPAIASSSNFRIIRLLEKNKYYAKLEILGVLIVGYNRGVVSIARRQRL